MSLAASLRERAPHLFLALRTLRYALSPERLDPETAAIERGDHRVRASARKIGDLLASFDYDVFDLRDRPVPAATFAALRNVARFRYALNAGAQNRP